MSPSVAVTSRSFSKHPVLRAELLERYPDARLNDEGASLRDDALVEFLSGCEKAITALEPITEEVLAQLPDLRVISKVGVGIDMIDLDAMDRHGVRLGWTPGTNSRSVSELVIAHVLAALRHVPALDAGIRRGEWEQRKGATLSGRTVGIVGFGNVGRDLAGLLAAFGCPVLAYDVRELRDLPPHVRAVELDELVSESDVISLHVALTQETRDLFHAKRISEMRPGSVLVSTARGGLIDEDALARALRSGHLAGAGLDVFAIEPVGESPLLALQNVVLTPHIGGSTEEAVIGMGRAAIKGLDGAMQIADLPR